MHDRTLPKLETFLTKGASIANRLGLKDFRGAAERVSFLRSATRRGSGEGKLPGPRLFQRRMARRKSPRVAAPVSWQKTP